MLVTCSCAACAGLGREYTGLSSSFAPPFQLAHCISCPILALRLQVPKKGTFLYAGCQNQCWGFRLGVARFMINVSTSNQIPLRVLWILICMSHAGSLRWASEGTSSDLPFIWHYVSLQRGHYVVTGCVRVPLYQNGC